MDTEIRPYISWRPAVKCRYRVDLWRRPPREVHTSLEDEEELLQLLEDPRRLGIGRQS